MSDNAGGEMEVIWATYGFLHQLGRASEGTFTVMVKDFTKRECIVNTESPEQETDQRMRWLLDEPPTALHAPSEE